MTVRIYKKITISLLFLLFAACSQKPAEIYYRSDECTHCRMMIMDARFASQIVTQTGKALKFDSIECMLAYSQDEDISPQTAKFWVNDFNNPENWMETEHAIFIKSEEIQSPMGGYLLALQSEDKADTHLSEYAGISFGWDELVNRQLTNH